MEDLVVRADQTLNLEQAKYIDRSCSTKRRYSNKNVAMRKAREAREKRGESNIEHYRCRLGQKHWHIGHKIGSKKS